MDDIADDGVMCEPLSMVSSPGSDVAFLHGSTTLYSFADRGPKYLSWFKSRCGCDCFGRLYRRLFPLGYKKEFKSLIAIAWPITVTTFFQQLLFLVTSMFVGHLGQLQLDAAALGLTMTNVTGLSVMAGLASACDTLFPQIYGSSNRRNLGIVLQKALVVLLLLCIPCWAIFINVEHVLLATGQDPVVANLAGQFALCYIPILPANALYCVLSKYLQAQSVVIPSCLILLAGNLLNAALLALFLFWLKMELLGASLAIGLSFWAVVFLHVGYIKASKIYQDTWSGWSVQCLSEWKVFFSLALPGLFMMCLEWWCFEIVVILAGLLSGVELATHSIVFQLSVIMFMFALGMAVASSVRVGNHLGEGNPMEAMTAAHVSISIMWVLALFVALLLLLLRRVIPLAFTNEKSVIDLIIQILPMIALFHLFDATQGVCSGVLRGSGKQLFGATMNFFSYYVIALPIGALLMFKTFLRLEGMWSALILSVFLQSMAFLIKIGVIDWTKQSKLAQNRAGATGSDQEPTDKDISPLHRPMSMSDTDLMEADHIQLSTYSSLESVRSSQSDELTDLQKTLLKRGVFVVCLLMVLAMGIIIDRVLSHLNNHSNCFLILGKDLNLTLIYHDLHSNQTMRNLTLDEVQFLNTTYWFEREHHGNATFTYCNGFISERPDPSATLLNMSSYLFNFHPRMPHRPVF
ncbi:multidrug and toxin extrusion protein 1-like [Haliotis rufescens]|uniref:multidrug and toxin extrusion protein 1-like n=1 Tax=Haliotis rufescens TaxID=6454 RepID=UPI001EB06523|nr:multidrug and toxin extrusion protein 1-like [Haliotis rufescens]